MQVNLYAGCLSLVKRSGVGQAFLHQKEMLERIGVQATSRWSESAEAVHFNTVFPDSFMASLIARRQKKKIVYYGHSTMEDFKNSFQYSNLLAPLFKRWITAVTKSAM
jgi:1,2-diacylglycerol-3-alpha-glucose alpha-1,2-glucosyltransferase